MMSQVPSCCRSCKRSDSPKDETEKEDPNHVETLRFKILSAEGKDTDAPCGRSFGPISLLEFFGDMPQIIKDPIKEAIASQVAGYKTEPRDRSRHPKRHQPTAINTLNITRSFDVNGKFAMSRSITIESTTNASLAWGKLTTSLPLFESEGEPTTARRDGQITLTVGAHIINGKYVDLESGDHFLVLRKVEDHCSCICTNGTSDGECTETHEAYFEISGVTRAKVVFSERPSIIQHSADMGDGSPWFICPSEDLELTDPQWLLIRVAHAMVDMFTAEQGYFKLLKNYSGSKQSRLVLSLRGETYLLERVELGGKILLVNPMRVNADQDKSCNILSVVGRCTYVHNLIKTAPNLSSTRKEEKVSLQTILDSLPASDAQIKRFLMNAVPASPCDYMYTGGVKFAYLDPILSAEFSIALLRTLDIHFAKSEKPKSDALNPSIRDVWTMVMSFQQEFDFLPPHMRTPKSLFQIMRGLCDIREAFTDLEDYLNNMGDEDKLLDTNMQLNLFKIHRKIVRAIIIANEKDKMTYLAVVKKIDSLLFGPSVPSYLFDGMIQYLINGRLESDDDIVDYVTCLKFYYERLSFTDVAEKMSRIFNNKTQTPFDATQFSLSGKKLFAVDTGYDNEVVESKSACLNYGIFKLNTKGLTQLRFKHAMNFLLSLCRSPLSLHLSFVSESLVAKDDGVTCMLQMYRKEDECCLRDVLSSLFTINQRWNLEDMEKKMARFLGSRTALESVTGPPNFHARVWITKQKNTLNYERTDSEEEHRKSFESEYTSALGDGMLQHIEEEAYIIINSNVPTV
ncbi:hypothetical protein, conserved [Babesia bigemina]|uniref:Uncharacterized protein n=1 Tax=Babesia bigemina TaxID=5866 RepID=A0A061D8N0_BABBI|nr:hypothetical protein, conserved [Babesia bigemina]CDR97071.1 hypothetical protein, conserved [Babesia bigemina]|eukprot:XP_012769257.1 hypothetical protein, conserved [Babesia bigemina]